MDTTLARDSIIGDAWIMETQRAVPIRRVYDANGNPTMNFLSGPVRLSFPALFAPEKQFKADPNSKLKYQATLQFPDNADLSPLYEEYYRVCAADFASERMPDGSYQVGNPFSQQMRKSTKYASYSQNPNAIYISTHSNYKPDVVDTFGNAITDPNLLYPGCWVIAAINCYASGKGTPNKGPRFGLVQVMKIADDKPQTGGAPDAKQTFAGVNLRMPVTSVPTNFGSAPAQPPRQGTAPFYSQTPQQPAGAPPQPVQQWPAAAPIGNPMSQFD